MVFYLMFKKQLLGIETIEAEDAHRATRIYDAKLRISHKIFYPALIQLFFNFPTRFKLRCE